MAKNVGYGSVLIVCSTDNTTENNIAQVRSITGPGVSGNDVDTTTMDSTSNYRTFVAGLLDPGELTFNLVYDSTSTTHALLAHLMGERHTGVWKVCIGSTGGTATTFSGHIKGMSREIPLDDVITCDVTVKVSGLPGYTT